MRPNPTEGELGNQVDAGTGAGTPKTHESRRLDGATTARYSGLQMSGDAQRDVDVADRQNEERSPPKCGTTRITRRRLLQATGGALAVGAGAAALYGGLSLIAPPARRAVGPPKG